MDVTVQELQTRLRQGKVYKPEKVEQALTNFFRETNLSTLRELALRAVADEIGEKAASHRQREGLEPALDPGAGHGLYELERGCAARHSAPARGSPAASARTGMPSTSKRRGRRRAHITRDDRQRAAAEHCAGGERWAPRSCVSRPIKPADGLIAFAKREGITHVIFGQSAGSRWEILLKGSTLNRFLEEVRDAAVQVVPLGEGVT